MGTNESIKLNCEPRVKLGKQTKALRIYSNPRKGHKLSKNTIEKMRKPKQIFVCDVCKKSIGGKSNLLRWHNQNCKRGNYNV